MKRRDFLPAIAAPLFSAAAPKPNIILILADDMGFSDIGCYGSEITTPHLDSLAKGGVRFTNFYNGARCCPTRASMLSGLYAHQTGVGHMVDNGRELPGYTGDLNRSCVTLAEALKSGGYQTRMVGKWHVTPVTKSKDNWPNQRGFDHFYGTIHGAGSYYDPVSLTEDNEPAKVDKNFYYTDAIAAKATSYIEECASRREPFFLYTAFTAPHWPMHAAEPDIAKYRAIYRKGWDELRTERHARQVASGLLDRRWPLAPRDAVVPAWAETPNKAWQVERMAVYAAMVTRLDQGIGSMIAALKKTKTLDNTLICFLSDNGGCAEELGRQMKALHVPKQTRDGAAMVVGNAPEKMPGPEDTYQSYGIGWANASNTPFRLYKHWVHEGGIATPFIAHWPGHITKPGSLTNQPGHLVDLMTTFMDASKTTYPKTHAGNSILPMEGSSLLPVFQGKNTLSRRTLCWEHEGNRAIREGKHKLVSKRPGGWELYDLDQDRTELHDLSSAQPAVVARLASKYEDWAKRVGAEAWATVQAAPKISRLLD